MKNYIAKRGGALLALLMTMGILFFSYVKNIKRLIASIIILLCFAVLAYAVMPASQQERVNEMADISHTRNIRTRSNIWHVTVQGIRSAPILGRGYASFKPYYEQFLQEHYAELQKKFPGYVEDYADHAHNLILHVAYAYGGLGSAFFIALICFTLALAIRKKDKFIISLLLYTLISGMTEVYIQRSNAIAIIFFSLGLFYGEALREGPGSRGYSLPS